MIDYRKKIKKINYVHPRRARYIQVSRVLRPGESLRPDESVVLGTRVATRLVRL